MKVRIMLFLAFLPCVAQAEVSQCVKLDYTVKCTSAALSTFYNKSNWTVNCSGVKVSGIAHCSTTSGTDGSVAETIGSGDANSKTHCWCMMTYPALSMWGWRYDYGSDANYSNGANACSKYCASGCRNAFYFNGTEDRKFLKSLYDSLRD